MGQMLEKGVSSAGDKEIEDRILTQAKEMNIPLGRTIKPARGHKRKYGEGFVVQLSNRDYAVFHSYAFKNQVNVLDKNGKLLTMDEGEISQAMTRPPSILRILRDFWENYSTPPSLNITVPDYVVEQPIKHIKEIRKALRKALRKAEKHTKMKK